MSDPLYELLAPYLDDENTSPFSSSPRTAAYLSRLCTLSLSDLTSTEPASLLYSAQSQLRNLQALSKRSRRAVISSSTELANLANLLPTIKTESDALRTEIPALESAAATFAEKYDRSTENEVLDRRKRAALLSRNVDRMSDILDMPSLLSSTVTAGQSGNASTAGSAGLATSHASALDIYAHVKRLGTLYPQSELVASISVQAEQELQNLATILITSLRSPSLKLASAMRTVGYLRRVAPELSEDNVRVPKQGVLTTKSMALTPNPAVETGAIDSLFLICRLYTLNKTLEALDPLRDLAEQESTHREKQGNLFRIAREPRLSSEPSSVTFGSQSERFLKRYIEIFREQSFGIMSMYKSIFALSLPSQDPVERSLDKGGVEDALLPLPSPLCSFALHLVKMLEATLRRYLPNVIDTAARESLLTQVLYCAGSLGRLGAEFGMMIAVLEEDLTIAGDAPDDVETDADGNVAMTLPSGEAVQLDKVSEPEWVSVMLKHRVQASRLEALARGVGGGRKTSMEVPPVSSASPMAARQAMQES